MAWEVPTLRDLVERSRASFATYMPGADATVFPSNLLVAAKVIGARVWELYHRQAFIAQQASPITAVGEYLERHAQIYGINRQVDIPSRGFVIISGGTHTTLIPTGTQFQDAAGVIVQTSEDIHINSDGEAVLPIEAVLTGVGQEIEANEEVAMLAAIAGAPAVGTISSDGFYGGSNVETDASLRDRLLFRLRYPPHAGSESDYIRWTREVSGVTRVWVEGNGYGPGTVALFFMMDDAYVDGLPSAADVAAVQAYIDDLKPITAQVVVAAPQPIAVPIEITGLHPLSSSVVNNIMSELEAVVKYKAVVSTPNRVSFFRRSWVWQAVSNATGEQYHTVTSPAEDFAVPVGFIPVFDSNFVKVGA